MKNFLFILAAIFALSTTQARADEGFYAGVFGGANWLEINSKHVSADFDTGYVVGGAIGYRWCGGLRTEFEIGYRNNDIKKAHAKFRRAHHDSCSESSSSDYSDCSESNRRRDHVKGHVETVSYMFNGLYDYQFECTPWKAYVGAGIGYANQRFHAKKRNHKDSCCEEISIVEPSSSSDCSDSSRRRNRHGKNNNGFAAQAIVGLAYNFCDNIDFTVEYRYMYVNGRSGSRNNNDRNDTSSRVNGKFSNSNNNAIVIGAQTGF